MSKLTDLTKSSAKNSFWIKGAIKKPGALTAQAKAKGETPMEFARGHEKSKGVTGKRARLALTLNSFHKK
jgi:hypothetical protein